MPSATIPENIIGVPLFVPDANNFFEINTGGMPNGDDCLRVRGDLSRNHKAFMPSPATTPRNINLENAAFSMSFWISGPTTGWTNDSVIMSIENASAGTASGANANRVWSVFVNGSTGSLAVFRGFSSGAFVFSLSVTPGLPAANGWRFCVINFPSLTGAESTGASFNDDGVNPVATDGQSSTFGTVPSNLFLSIGGYANAIGANVNYRLGKIAFHDHHLTATERLALWNAMVSP